MNSRIILRMKTRQRGASAVEFGIIAVVFFTLLFGIIEFGRFFYLYNTVQEVTRCAARKAVVNWSNQWGSIQQQCLFGQNELVAGWEIGTTNVRFRHLNVCDDPSTPKDDAVVANPGSATDNIEACSNNTSNCIRFVEARLWCTGTKNCANNIITYQPMFGLIPLQVGIPGSTVCMPAESLGYGT